MSARAVIKASANRLLRPFGYEMFVARRRFYGTVPIDRQELLPYVRGSDDLALYYEGLGRSGGEATDNFSKQCRFTALLQHVQSVRGLSGDVAECGCWKGHSTYMIARRLHGCGVRDRLHVFDSFEGGLSDLGTQDTNARGALTPEQVRQEKELFASSEQTVAAVLQPFDFVTLYKGWIPERFHEVADRSFRLVHVDVDLYQPTRDSLAFFYPRLVDGGIIAIDDYWLAQFPGCTTAVDEFVKEHAPRFFFALPTGGAFLVK